MNYGVLTFNATQQQNEISLNFVEVLNLTTNKKQTITGGTAKILKSLTTCGIDFIYVLDGSAFFGFIDYYAMQNNLTTFDNLNDNSGFRKRLNVEAWSYRNSENTEYSRKIWLFSTAPNTRHKRLHSVTFMNLSPVTACYTITELLQAVNINSTGSKIKDLANGLKEFDRLYNSITGLPFLSDKFPAAWTMGGASRSFYLRLAFPNATGNRLKLYQYSHPQNINTEYFLRERKLLSAGLLYLRDNLKHSSSGDALIKKYDVNSLFADREKDLPALGKLHLSSFQEYKKDKSGLYEYIFITDYLLLKARPGMPRVFRNPFERYSNNAEYVEITEEWAVFAPLLEEIKQFYLIEDMSFTTVFKASKIEDKAVKEYVDILYKYKANARACGENGLANLVKYFLVNLHGKFAQKTLKTETIFSYNNFSDAVQSRQAEEIIDEWESKHFDYIRGAYIYAMARVKIMQLIREFEAVLPVGESLEEHIFYNDTDSIITDLTAPAEIVDRLELGKLKLEEEFETFQAIKPKVYYGRTKDDKIKLTCAGIDKAEVIRQIEEERHTAIENLTDNELEEILTDCNRLYAVKVLMPMKGGRGYAEIQRALTALEIF